MRLQLRGVIRTTGICAKFRVLLANRCALNAAFNAIMHITRKTSESMQEEETA